MELRPKKLHACLAMPPAPVRVPGQRSLTPSVTSVADDKGGKEIIPGAVYRSPGICLTTEKNSGKPQLGEHLMKGLYVQLSLEIGSLTSKLRR